MKKMYKVLFRQNGSITLFAALSMSFLIIFFMVVIDISRLFLFSKLTESSTKLASRSVMSAYDLMLYERYGLFGKGGTDGQLIAEQIMRDNMTTELNIFDFTPAMKLTPIEIEMVDVVYEHFLGEHDELERQIVEEMKYKGPIDFSIELIETFAGIEQAGKTTKSLVSSLKGLEELFEQREAVISQLFESQQKLVDIERKNPLEQGYSTITSGYSGYISDVKNEQSLLERREQLYATLAQQEAETTEEQEEELKDINRELESVGKDINKYASTANKSLLESEKNLKRLQDALPEFENAFEEQFNLAQTLNNTISIQYELLIMKQAQASEPQAEHVMVDELYMDISDEGLIRPPSFFREYDRELKTQIMDFSDYIKQANSFIKTARQAIQNPNLTIPITSSLTASYQTFRTKRNSIYDKYVSPASVLNERLHQINELDGVKQQLKANKQQYAQLINDMNYLSQLAKIYELLQKDEDTFIAVHQNYNRNLTRNLLIEEQSIYAPTQIDEEGNENAERTLEQLTGLISSMNKIGKQLQAHLYRNEYVIQRFKHLPLGNLKVIEGNNAQSFGFHNQAVEYIMIGLKEPSANISIVIAEIFAIRLAIRTIEGFIANKHLANPLLILSAAVLYGLQHSLKDMDELFAEGETELSKYAKVDVSYRHYLRLLLSIHGLNRKGTLSRIAGVIEHDLSVDLMQVATSSIVVTETKTKLWMLPIASPLLSNSAKEKLNVESGYYEKVDFASSSY